MVWKFCPVDRRKSTFGSICSVTTTPKHVATAPNDVSTLKIPGACFVVSLGVIALVPVAILKFIALIAAVISGWLLVFRGATVVSHRLTGRHRQWFTVVAALAFPALISLYFLQDVRVFTFSGVFGHMVSPWFLFPVVVIAYFSWIAAEHIDEEHSIRGFLIAAAVLWLLCASGYSGVRLSDDDYDDDSADYVEQGRLTGRYFGQFLVYVGIAYGTMLVRLEKNRREGQRSAQ